MKISQVAKFRAEQEAAKAKAQKISKAEGSSGPAPTPKQKKKRYVPHEFGPQASQKKMKMKERDLGKDPMPREAFASAFLSDREESFEDNPDQGPSSDTPALFLYSRPDGVNSFKAVRRLTMAAEKRQLAETPNTDLVFSGMKDTMRGVLQLTEAAHRLLQEHSHSALAIEEYSAKYAESQKKVTELSKALEEAQQLSVSYKAKATSAEEEVLLQKKLLQTLQEDIAARYVLKEEFIASEEFDELSCAKASIFFDKGYTWGVKMLREHNFLPEEDATYLGKAFSAMAAEEEGSEVEKTPSPPVEIYSPKKHHVTGDVITTPEEHDLETSEKGTDEKEDGSLN